MQTINDDDNKSAAISLQEDLPLRGQSFACLSFLSPERILTSETLARTFADFSDLREDVGALIDALSSRHARNDRIFALLQDLRNSHDYLFDVEALRYHYEQFLADKQAQLEREFYEANEHHTCSRCVKIRGVYDTVHDARVRAQQLKQTDGNFDIFIAQVGLWCPLGGGGDDAETHMNTLAKAQHDLLAKEHDSFGSRLQGSGVVA
jgi:hypothetical protein